MGFPALSAIAHVDLADPDDAVIVPVAGRPLVHAGRRDAAGRLRRWRLVAPDMAQRWPEMEYVDLRAEGQVVALPAAPRRRPRAPTGSRSRARRPRARGAGTRRGTGARRGADMPKNENRVVGLDIGTTKILAVVGEITDKGLDIVGIGTAPRAGCARASSSTSTRPSSRSRRRSRRPS